MIKKGTTLIELLIVISLIGLISIVISSVYVSGYKTFRQELASSTIQSDAQTILDSLMTDIKNGLLIEEQYDIYTTSETSIIIRVPSVDADDNILYEDSNMLFDRIVYYYSDEAIHKIIFAEPNSVRYPKSGKDFVLDRKILELNFSYEPYDPDVIAPTLVTATIFTQSELTPTITRSIRLTGQARLRNHI